MFKALLVSLKLSLFTFACLFASPTLAQVTTDGTVDTQVNQNGNVAEITGGETRGSNLFHSFQDFSVPTSNEAFFNNADNISNIFSRVTGGNISNIDGAIRANGSASLFLINPAGIIFGENARLDIGGSFYGSTASSILFEDGEFSAVDNLEQPILTVNAPIGLGFRDEPGEIINRSTANNGGGLDVSSGSTLALIGGDINFEAGRITGSGVDVKLGGLSQAGTVSIDEDNNFTFPTDIAKSNITLINDAGINVAGTSGGNITINAQNLNLEARELGNSFIATGISPDSTSPEAQAGDIDINVNENISLSNSGIFNQVFPDGVGNSGNIIITSGSLEILNGGQIDTGTFGTGNSGVVDITTAGNITIDGENSQSSQASVISSGVGSNARGNAGGVKISADNLALSNNAQIFTNTFGEGNGGNIDIATTGDLTVDVPDRNFNSVSIGITSAVESSAVGNGGDINIAANNLTLTNNAEIGTNTFGQGDAGKIDITTTEDLTVDTQSRNLDINGINSRADSIAVGNAGDINIATANLTVTNGGGIGASSFGPGNSGSINIAATENITIDSANVQSSQDGLRSSITSVAGNNEGSGEISGEINITATNLTLTNGGEVSASAFGAFANAGDINIDIAENIIIDGQSSFGLARSNIRSSTDIDIDSTGDAGNINISTANLSLTNGGEIVADTRSQGNAGDIEIEATENIVIDGVDSNFFPSGITSEVSLNILNNRFGTRGNAGNIGISTANLILTNGGEIASSSFGEGNAGNITIVATESIFISGFVERSLNLANRNFRSGVSVSAAGGTGNGGNLNIFTDLLTIEKGGSVDAGNFDRGESFDPSTGQPGNINIEANFINLATEGRIETRTQSETGISGNINLQVADNITLRNNSFISAQAFENANGGNLNIDTNFIIAFPGNNDIIASAEQGQGGNININAESLFGIEERPLSDSTNDINASSEFSLDGTVDVSTPDVNPAQGVAELPTNIVIPQETAQQACEANRESAAKNGLSITGKGGIVPDPGLSLNSLNVYVDGESTSAKVAPEAIATAEGKIQPARGVQVTKSGEVILTAYRTNNTGERTPEIKPNCN